MESNITLLEQFRDCHRQLDELFLLHQETLLQARLDGALKILRCYAVCHELHMQVEDDVLLPKYANLQVQGKWDETLYRQEHHKIRDLYQRIEKGLSWLIEQDLSASQLRRNIIQLLDREKSFKGLCEHHQEREESSLLIELDRQTDANWRTEVQGSFSILWKQKVEEELKIIEAPGVCRT